MLAWGLLPTASLLRPATNQRCLLQEEATEMADPVKALLEGKAQTVEFSNGNVVVDAPRSGRVYMAGSFNPLHEGHRGMLAAALQVRQDKQGWPFHPLVWRFIFIVLVLET